MSEGIDGEGKPGEAAGQRPPLRGQQPGPVHVPSNGLRDRHHPAGSCLLAKAAPAAAEGPLKPRRAPSPGAAARTNPDGEGRAKVRKLPAKCPSREVTGTGGQGHSSFQQMFTERQQHMRPPAECLFLFEEVIHSLCENIRRIQECIQ